MIKNIAIAVLAVIAVASAVYNFYKPSVVTSTQSYQPATVEHVVEKVKIITVPVEKLVVYDKSELAKKVELPAEIMADDRKVIPANAEVQPYEGKTSVFTVTDTETGKSEMIVKQKPLPFFDLKNDKEIGARILASTSGGFMASIYGRWTFFRTGSIRWAGYGEIRSPRPSQEVTGGVEMLGGIDMRHEF